MTGMMESDTNQTRFSLSQAKSDLKRCSWAKQLVHFIDRFSAVKSALLDLKQVRETLDLIALRERARCKQGSRIDLEVGDAVIDRALAAHAIILYSRATRTSSNHRSSLPTNKWLGTELTKGHARIIGLRNDCIGHFGPGNHNGGEPWIREDVGLVLTNDGQSDLSFSWARSNHRFIDLNLLDRLITHIIPHVEKLLDERHTSLMDEIAKVSGRREFRDVLVRHRFDPEAFFGGHRSNGNTWQRRPS